MKGAWLAGVLMAIVPLAQADEPVDAWALVAQGNAQFAAGAYAEALRAYEAAAAAGAATPELLHNQAAAHFRLGQYAEARELWEQAAPLGDAQFEGRMRYNLGNCDYAEALAAQAVEPQQSVASLDRAAERYREALRLDPTLADARANLELTQLLKQQIVQATPQCQQSQPSEGGADEQGEQKQQQAQPSSRPSSQPQEQPAQQSSESSAEQKPDDQQQSQQSEGQRSAQDRQQSAGDQEQEQQQGERSEQDSAREDPAEAQSAAGSSDPSAREEQQGQAASEDEAGESREAQQAQVQLTPEQAERLLQMVRDAEKARREQLARQRAARGKPVERDW